MDCTDNPSMDIFEFLDLEESCKFSTDHYIEPIAHHVIAA